MRKSLLIAFLLSIFLSGLTLVSTAHFSTVHASTEVTGIITSDTTWTEADSPYSLTVPPAVNTSVTLTIEASTELEPIPKPSVPEFTVELVDSSYDVPTTYTIDPYTGENVTHAGYHVESTSIQVKIKNQPFASYYDASHGWTINFYYNIRMKGHFSEDWIELYLASDGYPIQDSESQYTVISLGSVGNPCIISTASVIMEFPLGAQVDFQVEAMIGYVSRAGDPPWYPWQLTGETSGWSETQTITIPTSTSLPTSSPSSTPTPDQTTEPTPESTPKETPQTLPSEEILGAAIVVAVIGAGLGLLIYLIKRK